jgi:hypothetical protein
MKRMVSVVLFAVIFSGCEYRYNVDERTDFDKLDEGSALKVYTVDGRLYEFTQYSVTDSQLIGRREGDFGAMSDGVQLPWRKIAYIQGMTSGAFRSIIAASAVGLFIGMTSYELSERTGLNVKEFVHVAGAKSSSGPSCPFIYSWTGAGYILEGGALGTAFGKAMEGTTTLGLPLLRADAQLLRIRIANERPETEYLNAVRLFAVDPGPGEDIAFADDGSVWPVKARLSPSVAVSAEGLALTDLLRARDARCWNPGANTSSSYSSAEIVIVDTTRSRTGSILISCQNTPLVEGAFLAMCDFLGDAYWEFVYALEHDPAMLGMMERWFDKNGLHIDVQNGDTWSPAGCVIQRGNALAFERVLRLNLPERFGDTLRLRVRLRSDLWQIDAIAFDPAALQPLERKPVPLLSALTSRGESADGALKAMDDSRLLLLPPEYVDLTFGTAPGGPGRRYGMDVSGYLYEWKMNMPNSPYADLRRWIPDAMRLSIVKFVMGRKGFFVRWIQGNAAS